MNDRVKTKIVSISLDVDLISWVDNVTAHNRITRSRFVNQLIYESMFMDKWAISDSSSKKSSVKGAR